MEVMKTNKLTDVGTRVTCSRPSRRRELYSLPWDRRRHSDHRRRVQSAGPRIDNTPPASSVYTHVRSVASHCDQCLPFQWTVNSLFSLPNDLNPLCRDNKKRGQQERERQAVIQVFSSINKSNLSNEFDARNIVRVRI